MENIRRGQRLKELRRVLGYKQYEFAEHINMKKSTYNTIEKGRHALNPCARHLLELKYNVNLRWLDGEGGDMFVEKPEFQQKYWELKCRMLEGQIERQNKIIDALLKKSLQE